MERLPPARPGRRADDGAAALVGERGIAGIRIGERCLGIGLDSLDDEAGALEPRRDVALGRLLPAEDARPPDELGSELEELLAATCDRGAKLAFALPAQLVTCRSGTSAIVS